MYMNLPDDVLYQIIIDSDVLPLVFVNKTLYSIFKLHWYKILIQYNLMFQTSYYCYAVVRGCYHVSFCDTNTSVQHVYNKIRYVQNAGRKINYF